MAGARADIEADCASPAYRQNLADQDEVDGGRCSQSTSVLNISRDSKNTLHRYQHHEIQHGNNAQNSFGSTTRRNQQSSEEPRSPRSSDSNDSAYTSYYSSSSTTCTTMSPTPSWIRDSGNHIPSSFRDSSSKIPPGFGDSGYTTMSPPATPILFETVSHNQNSYEPATKKDHQNSEPVSIQESGYSSAPSTPRVSTTVSSTSSQVSTAGPHGLADLSEGSEPIARRIRAESEKSSSSKSTVGPSSRDSAQYQSMVDCYDLVPAVGAETQIPPQNRHVGTSSSTESFHSVTSHMQSFHHSSLNTVPTQTTAGTTDVPQITEVPVRTDVQDGTDIPETTDVPEITDIPETPDVPKTDDVQQATNFPEAKDAPETKLTELDVMVNVSSTRGEDSSLEFQETQKSDPEDRIPTLKAQSNEAELVSRRKTPVNQDMESNKLSPPFETSHRKKQERTSSRRTRDSELSENSDSKEVIALTDNLTRLQVGSTNPKKIHHKRSTGEDYTQLHDYFQGFSQQDLKDIFTNQNSDGDNILMLAVIYKFKVLAQVVVSLVPFADRELLDIRNKRGQTALHLTVITHQWRLSRKLILAGANLQARDLNGNTPLHVACIRNDLDSVITLTKTVTCLEIPEKEKREKFIVPQPSELYNYYGQTCLHIAAFHNNTILVRFLVEMRFSAEVNAPERLSGKTALHIAAELGNLELVEYLLAREETNPDAETYARHTALDLAYGSNQTYIARLLERSGVQTQHPETDDESDSSSEDEEEEDKWTASDFQCSMMSRSLASAEELSEYDDICVKGTLVRSLYSLS